MFSIPFVDQQRSELLALICRLGAEFRRRGMSEHLRRLRVYYLAVRHRLTRGRNELDVRWSEAHVLDWLRALQVPPYDRAWPVRPRGSGCPTCGVAQGETPSGRTELVFPGGTKLRCRECGASWLELDA